MADEGQIEQVIMNLAVNGADAMPSGGVLSIDTGYMELAAAKGLCPDEIEAGPYVILTVTDTGCGMDSRTMSSIFEPFFTTKGEKGSGLGLSTVYGIIKQHGGHILCESEPGKGTTFTIYLPATNEKIVKNKGKTSREKLQGGSETILVAEDNQKIRRLTSKVLTRHGYHVYLASTGREAVNLLKSTKEPVHLLLTDVIMPEMNGKDLYKEAKAIDSSLKVVFMSGYTDDIVHFEETSDGSNYFIKKPFTMKELTQKVREVLDEKDGESDGRSK